MPVNRVRLSSLARADLDDIWFYVARDNEAAGTRVVRNLLDKCRSIRSHPNRGTPCPDLAPGLRRLTVGNYLIFYRVTDTGPEVARILHRARDLAKHFPKR